jgi:tRNA G18 (ribose-2'-O)-methylase SpoU
MELLRIESGLAGIGQSSLPEYFIRPGSIARSPGELYTLSVRAKSSIENFRGSPGEGRKPGLRDYGGGDILFEGAWLVERAFASSLQVLELLCVPSRRTWAENLIGQSSLSGSGQGISLRILAESEISGFAGYPFHRGALATAKRPPATDIDSILALSARVSGTILVLPETRDPENLGACFRNAAAFGCPALLIGPDCPDPFSRRILRVSMGSVLSIPWARISSPAELTRFREAGYSLAASVLDPEARDIRSWTPPPRLALLLGNEAFGLSDAWLETCDLRLTLPMAPGVDSLNVATAGAIFLYTLSERRSSPVDH